MLKKILLITLLVSAGYCSNAQSTADENAQVVRSQNFSFGKLTKMAIDTLWWSIGMNAQTARSANEASVASREAANSSREAASSSLVAAHEVRAATDEIRQESKLSRDLLNQLQQRDEEIARLRITEERFNNLLSQTTHASVAEEANRQRDRSIRKLQENLQTLEIKVTSLANEKATLESRLNSVQIELAKIIDPNENNLDNLLIRTAQRIESLEEKERQNAEGYMSAIRELQSQIQQKVVLSNNHNLEIAVLNANIDNLRIAAHQFEGNGYNRIFELAERAKSGLIEVHEAQQQILALIVHAYVLYPEVPFSKLIYLDGKEMWINRLLSFCKYTDISNSGVSEDNKTRPLNISAFLMPVGSEFVKVGQTITDFNNPQIKFTEVQNLIVSNSFVRF